MGRRMVCPQISMPAATARQKAPSHRRSASAELGIPHTLAWNAAFPKRKLRETLTAWATSARPMVTFVFLRILAGGWGGEVFETQEGSKPVSRTRAGGIFAIDDGLGRRQDARTERSDFLAPMHLATQLALFLDNRPGTLARVC